MNKHLSLIAAGLIALGGLAGCNKTAKNTQDNGTENSPQPIELTHVEYSKEDSLLDMELSALLPTGNDAVSTAIRDTLLQALQSPLADCFLPENKSVRPAKDIKDVAAFAEECHKMISKQRMEDEKEYGFSINAPYEWQLTIDTLAQTDRYITFTASGYQYMGGAHGGVIGRGAITFSKADGKPFTHWFTNPADPALHRLLLGGIAEYFSQDEDSTVSADSLDNYLLVKPAEVGLPAESPHPTPDGLGFTYGQYEIAPYAAGMPAFILPYDCVKPYLTPEARELLAL